MPKPRQAIGCLAALVMLGAAGVSAPAQAAPRTVPGSQALVALTKGHVVRAAPRASGRRVTSVSARRPLTRVRTILPVLGSARDGAWLRVRLPGRPNGRSGWISSDATRALRTKWRLALSLSRRRLSVFRGGRLKRRFDVVIGAGSTPTPRGRFFIEEAVKLAAGEPGGPFALATSARSDVLQEFNGGPGQIALHGTRGLVGAPRSAASHGCVRLSTAAITWLAGRIGSGVPLSVTR